MDFEIALIYSCLIYVKKEIQTTNLNPFLYNTTITVARETVYFVSGGGGGLTSLDLLDRINLWCVT